jgi:parallel beta-helix repeat protein
MGGRRIIASLALALTVLHGAGATATSSGSSQFYVAPTGSDTAAGTLAAPWKTLQHAADVVGPGATVRVRAGTYAPFIVKRSGSSLAPIRFAAFTGEKPVVDAKLAVPYTIRLFKVSWVTVSGLSVTGGYGARQTGGGFSVENSWHVGVIGNDVHHNRAFGVRVVGSSDALVENNDIHDNAVGVRIDGAAGPNIVRGNQVHDNSRMMVNTPDIAGDDAGGDGIAIVSSTGQVTVEKNRLWRNRAWSYDWGYDGGAFSVYASSNWTIRDNVIWDNRNVLETGTNSQKTPCDNGSFVRNLSYGATTVDRSVGMVLRCASNTLVANNTFAGLQYFTFDISNFRSTFGGSIDGLRIVNNVVSVSVGKVYGLESALPASVVIDNNVVYDSGTGYFASSLGTGYKTLAAFQAAIGRDLHSISRDPLFVAPETADYSLTPSSPAVDGCVVVTGVTDGFAGLAPDCGYAELRQP